MIQRRPLLLAATAAALSFTTAARAEGTIKIGEINSYKAQPAFLEPYKKGMELAVEQINAAGGVNGKKLEPWPCPCRSVCMGWFEKWSPLI